MPERLDAPARRIIAAHGAALIEEYVVGREIAVFMAENPDDAPVVFEPLELVSPEGERFFHFKLKWSNYDALEWRPITDTVLAEKLRVAAAKAFVAVEARSYARCDFRVGADNEPWLLEINPTCSIFYPPTDADIADRILLRSELGHRGFVDLLLRAARRLPVVAVRAAELSPAV